jgi:hypothetical protein
MDVDQLCNEAAYAARRARDLRADRDSEAEVWAMKAARAFLELDDHLSRGEQLPEPWADAARGWDYSSEVSRRQYAKLGAYLREGEAKVFACRDYTCDPESPRHATWCQHHGEPGLEPAAPLPPNVLPFREPLS